MDPGKHPDNPGAASARGVYRVPIQYLNGNAADILFWDAVYYLLEMRGQTDVAGPGQVYRYVETGNEELEAMTGLSRREIVKRRSAAAGQADPRYNLLEEQGFESRTYLLKLKDYEDLLQKNVIEKPASFMSNGWGPKLDYPEGRHSRFPLVVVNHFLRLPPGRPVTAHELVRRCQHPQRKKAPDISEIHKALALLQQLGLVEPAGEEMFRLDRSRFETAAALAWKQSAARERGEPEAVRLARQEDPERVELTLALARSGNFDLATHFAEIFRDLNTVASAREWALLKAKVYKHRHKPASPERWQHCWDQYMREVQNTSRQVETSKIHLDLKRRTRQTACLALPVNPETRLVWARLVLWLNDHNFYPVDYWVQVQLEIAGQPVWQRRLSQEEETVRCDLTAQLRPAPASLCMLVVETGERLSRVSLAARLEAAVWPEP